MARMLLGEAELVSELTRLSGRAKSVKRLERSDGLDTALYKNYLYLSVWLALSYWQVFSTKRSLWLLCSSRAEMYGTNTLSPYSCNILDVPVSSI